MGRRARASTIYCSWPAAAAPRSRSIAEIDAALYRAAGYRVCGERAVRVDILERLADLIRPVLAWREGAGPKPPGAVAGGGFTVVNGMTSLTGASGEDFASILRSLGYRMERRPKPQEPIVQPIVEPIVEPPANPAPEAIAAMPEAIAATPEAIAATNGGAPETAPAPEATSPSSTPATADQGQSEVSAMEQGEPGEAAIPPAEQTESSAHPDALPANGEREMIEVWRPGRPEGRHRPRPRRRDGRSQARKDTPISRRAEEPSVTAVSAGEVASAPPPEQMPPADSRPSREGRPSRHRRRPAGEQRPERAMRERERPPVKRFERREKAPDPNSPFAKLAALKAQLEADAKERR